MADIKGMSKPGGVDPLAKLMADFRELGGELKVCGPCIKERNIPESDLMEGAQTTATDRLIAESLKAGAVFVF